MNRKPLIIVVGADNAGYPLKERVKAVLLSDDRVAKVIDLGVDSVSDDMAYPHIGIKAAQTVRSGAADRALLCCGTGIGVAISANKVRGIRATVAHDSYSVERSVLSNNAQILCFGARVIAGELAEKLTREWLSHEFDDQSPSAAKVAILDSYDTQYDIQPR
jgi:ribose 5-phosphate isomerase B